MVANGITLPYSYNNIFLIFYLIRIPNTDIFIWKFFWQQLFRGLVSVARESIN